MKSTKDEISDDNSKLIGAFKGPDTVFCRTKDEFCVKIGDDFIKYANKITAKGEQCLIGLSHGQSPVEVYEYVIKNYHKLKHKELLYYTCINSKLKRQRGLVGVFDALSFLRKLVDLGHISKDQIVGRALDRDDMDAYCNGMNQLLSSHLKESGKPGLDYAFVAMDQRGMVAGITRNSTAFNTNNIVAIVNDTADRELTYSPKFLQQTGRIAFLVTKAEKRRPLAWMFYRWAKPNESPSFLRFIDDVENRLTVYIDDSALTWPQAIINRETGFGKTKIKIDLGIKFEEDYHEKLPVVLMVHGFLGLNTFDSLLAFIPSDKYVPAAMHYGSIPYELPKEDYSKFVASNIDAAVGYFGDLGHPVYIFDHSMANTYIRIIDQNFDDYKNVKKYVKGRIAANPFFGKEAKHAAQNFLDNVILKANLAAPDRLMFKATSTFIPTLTKNALRTTGIRMANWLTVSDSSISNRIWEAVKQRLMHLVSDMDSLPELNKIPLEHTLNRLPIKIFAIQVYSALKESKLLDKYKGNSGFEDNKIPVLILKSEIDPIAEYVHDVYDHRSNVTVRDITNPREENIFREHLIYMIHPQDTIKIIDKFISGVKA